MRFIISGNEHTILNNISTYIDNLPITREQLKTMSRWSTIFAGFCCDGIDKFLDKLSIVCTEILNHSAVNYNFDEDNDYDAYELLSKMFERLSDEIGTIIQKKIKDKMLNKLLQKYHIADDYLALQILFWNISVLFFNN